jgi:hypothetical protein
VPDSIDDEAINRIDQAVDPTALSDGAVREDLLSNPNIDGGAIRAFAERVSGRRDDVLDAGRELLSNRLSPNPANPEIIQLRDQDGQLGPRVPDEGSVDLDVDPSGEVVAEVGGSQVNLGRVDLDEGVSYQRSLDRYSREKHPAQREGGGGR